MQPTQASVARRVLDPMLAGVPLHVALVDVALEPGFPPVQAAPVAEVQPPADEIRLDREFIALLRANLQAASQHVALGHKARSFRECSRAACQDAAKLIPQLDEVEPGATDAELEAILDRVLAALEQTLPQAPAVRTGFTRGGTSWSAPMAK